METLNIAILDDDETKISRIKTKFIQQNDKNTEIYNDNYSDYNLNLIPIDVEQSCEQIVEEIMANNFDGIIIDYDFTSFAKTPNNGVKIANQINKKVSEYPLFILTAYEKQLFDNELFDAYQIYNYDNYLNNINATREFHSRLIEQILKSRKQKHLWETELKSLLKKAGTSVEIDSRILELDNKLEKSLDKECALDSKLKEDLSSNKLVELLQKIDKVLEED